MANVFSASRIDTTWPGELNCKMPVRFSSPITLKDAGTILASSTISTAVVSCYVDIIVSAHFVQPSDFIVF